MRLFLGIALLAQCVVSSISVSAGEPPRRRWPMIACDRYAELCAPQPEPEPEPRGTCYCTTFFPNEKGEFEPEICRSWDTQGGGDRSCAELEWGLRNLGQHVRCGIDVCFTKY